ncbi:hypothetical protein [Merdimonas faecis]|uniref:Uncharacterized protein n=1 Tax=Merdimonas faecis TaxID=1653435 RepID=A0A9D2VY52_9FIRM|nr:hypothetical protein [Merdimonas faecis]HJH50039.1 hypothetical protein [Merdimonas faecis]
MISAADFAALIFHGKQNKLNEDDNMKKLGYVLMVLLEAAALAGAYIINYFTNKKMGMARWVIYKNQGWERDYPMDTLKTAVMAVLILLTILVFLFFLKRKQEAGKLLISMNVVMILLTLLYVSYTVISSRETMRAYYFLSLLFGIAAAVQILKTGAAVLMCGKKSDEK